jgi:PQQ-dependent catabolism-associated CXXCW motif protein
MAWRHVFALMCLSTLCAAADATVTEPATVWAGNVDAPVPQTIAGGTVIHARSLARLLQRTSVLVVDVSNEPRRPPGLAPGAPWLPVPHRALPAAVWIPGVGAGELPPQLEHQFRDRLASALGEDRKRPVVFYCHARCWLSWNAAKRAIGYGYKQVYWFPDGIEGWTAGGLPTAVVDNAIAPESEPGPAENPASKPRLAILPLELTGDLGGTEFAAEHAARLEVESARLRRDLEGTQLYEVLDNASAQADIDKLESQQLHIYDCNGCDIGIGRTLNADLILVAWVYRVSGLILTLSYEIHSVKDAQILVRKSYDFRGDNDIAWNHAIDYMVRHLREDAVSVEH